MEYIYIYSTSQQFKLGIFENIGGIATWDTM